MNDRVKNTREAAKRASTAYFDFDRWLKRVDRREAAFKKLCEAGCDRNTLGSLFVLLTEPSLMKLESGAEIHLRRLDKESALNPLDPAALERIVKKAKSLIEDLRRLKQTPLVRSLDARGAFPPGDLLSGSTICGLVPAAFHGLLGLPERAREISHSTPDFDRILARIYEHIYACTGQPHDALVADVLGGRWNAAQLKMRRSRKKPKPAPSDEARYEGLLRALSARDLELQKEALTPTSSVRGKPRTRRPTTNR